MEIGVHDLASRIVEKTTTARGFTIAVRADRARAALYAARRQAAECARVSVSGVISNALRQDTADRLPAALAAIFDLADMVGADVGSLARSAVAGAAQWIQGANELEPRDPIEPGTRTGPLGPAVTEIRGDVHGTVLTSEPEMVDGHPWTKRDDIAQALFIAGCSARTALERADDLLRVRKEALDASRGAES